MRDNEWHIRGHFPLPRSHRVSYPFPRDLAAKPSDLIDAISAQVVVGGWSENEAFDVARAVGVPMPFKAMMAKDRERYETDFANGEHLVEVKLESAWRLWVENIAKKNDELFKPQYLRAFPQVVWSIPMGKVLLVRRVEASVVVHDFGRRGDVPHQDDHPPSAA